MDYFKNVSKNFPLQGGSQSLSETSSRNYKWKVQYISEWKVKNDINIHTNKTKIQMEGNWNPYEDFRA
jgi:hypothetical protein